ncbi:MAG: hypothetical protein GY909_01210 [Oligoflexia bacterium]|nr:hypothetical protein [Oligoflexia bacterium]
MRLVRSVLLFALISVFGCSSTRTIDLKYTKVPYISKGDIVSLSMKDCPDSNLFGYNKSKCGQYEMLLRKSLKSRGIRVKESKKYITILNNPKTYKVDRSELKIYGNMEVVEGIETCTGGNCISLTGLLTFSLYKGDELLNVFEYQYSDRLPNLKDRNTELKRVNLTREVISKIGTRFAKDLTLDEVTINTKFAHMKNDKLNDEIQSSKIKKGDLYSSIARDYEITNSKSGLINLAIIEKDTGLSNKYTKILINTYSSDDLDEYNFLLKGI